MITARAEIAVRGDPLAVPIQSDNAAHGRNVALPPLKGVFGRLLDLSLHSTLIPHFMLASNGRSLCPKDGYTALQDS